MAASSQKRKEEVLTKDRASHVADISSAIVIKDENIFFMTQPDGQVPLKGRHGLGLYYHDCRYLNGYELKIWGERPFPLAFSAQNGFHAELVLTNRHISTGQRKNIPGEQIAMTWNRMLDCRQRMFYDEIHVTNLSRHGIVLPVEMTFRCGFEDLFNVRGLSHERFGCLIDQGEWEGGVCRFSYQGIDTRLRSLEISISPRPYTLKNSRAVFHFRIGARKEKRLLVRLSLREGAPRPECRFDEAMPADFKRMVAIKQNSYARWFDKQTKMETDNGALSRAVTSSMRDLHLLRTSIDRQYFFAAGVPWFVTLFGRDTLVSAMQTLAFNPSTARQTLEVLAHYQGRKVDPWNEEEPGKILHELRIGEMASAGKIPYSPFYGSVDSTPLFVVLAAEYLFWTGDIDFFHKLRPHIDAALAWIDTYGDSDGDGYLDYRSPNHDDALINQGWKDSGNAMVREDGSTPQPPIAPVEVQGYTYRAKKNMAVIFKAIGEHRKAKQIDREAQILRRRFNRDFWIDRKSILAMALEKGGHPLRVVSSNAGRALWGGIVDAGKARRIARRLMAEDMYSGWGVRTLSTKEKAYNPLSYHLGSVWPHDNALLAAGLRRYGFDQKASCLWNGLMDAALLFKHERLPELFCGYPRRDFNEPVRYPVACHPQAWAAGSIPYMVQIMLGLFPNALERKLTIIRPMLPPLTEYIHLKKLKVADAEADLCFRKTKQGVKSEIINIDGRLHIEVKGS